jgi:rRNA maturation endonuclease Nob1
MKFVSAVLASLLMASTVTAFMPSSQRAFTARPLQMSDSEDAPGALVPIKEETVEFTAGILGFSAGFVVGGPVLGAIGSAAANYVSKMDGDVSTVIKAVSKSSIQVFNYLANLDKKYEVVNKAKLSLENSLNKLKAQETLDKEAIAKVESALDTTRSKIKEINDEYDLVGGGVTALGVVGDLVEKALKKAGELNEEYKLTEKASASLTGAIDKAKKAASEANTSA